MPVVPRTRSIPGAVGISVLVGIFAAALSFFASLFLSLVVFLMIGLLRGSNQIDMTISYRLIALPVAIAALGVGFIWALVDQVRKRSRTGLRRAA